MKSFTLKAFTLFCCLFTMAVHAAPNEENRVEDNQRNLHGDFDNPGGMWMPSQIPRQAELLRKLGLELDPKELSDPSSNLLQSIVSLGGCSGSFISEDGLIITNHHCVEAILTYLSQQDKMRDVNSDYFKTGYVARSRGQELSAGPAKEVFITTKFVDVTNEIRGGVNSIIEPIQRAKLVEARIKELVAKSEAKDPNIRAEVSSYFRQEKYFLIEKLRIRDVRLVYAPPAGVGFFGGDEDNWHWPRFTGDFALLRPYVGRDGKPAAYSPDNVPYKPKRHFRLSRRGLKLRDTVLVAGYPGSTGRLLTGEEFEHSVKKDIVEMIETMQRFQGIYEGLAAQNKELSIKTASARAGLANTIKNRVQGLEAIRSMDVVNLRLEFDRKLQAWIDGSDKRKAKFGTAIQDLTALNEKFKEPEAEKRAFDILRAPIFTRAMTIVRKGQQTTLLDEERDAAYQKRNWDVLSNGDKQIQGSLDKRIDSAFLNAVLKRMLELPRETQPAILDAVFGADRGAVSDERVGAKVAELLEQTTLYDLPARQTLLNETSWEQVKQSRDPLIMLAVELLPTLLEKIDKGRAETGEYMKAAYKYVRAKRSYLESQGKGLAPDANSTLRVTFGQVLEEKKNSDGKIYPAFTTLDELLEKNAPGKEDFEVPENVIAAAQDGLAAPFAGESGQVPVNFQANVDTTGGNSGSAALNVKGELVGLLFDGNEETLYSDWHFDTNVRSILVDVRYFLWTLFNVEKANHLLKEMDIVPECQELLDN